MKEEELEDIFRKAAVNIMDEVDDYIFDSQSLNKIRSDRKESFINYLTVNQDQRLWQALRNWAKIEYEKDFETGEKPEICYIFAGFDEEAMEDTFYWE